MAKKKNVEVLEVEGGFIAKEYDKDGSIVAQSEVFETEKEAKDADLVPLKEEADEE